eukprot:NODE_8218_length_1513_cov_12.576479.p1 GENE.NODE_8218_length_1513_cov_12.576479~~NODE_8218_length_1513_cov_12.576479.p1  ORF type:complete len:409 (-),score=56.60 NODE_8218_length_1513_cov_12.576479:184-1410(-)
MARLPLGPWLHYWGFVQSLCMHFIVQPSLLLSGHRQEEDILRRTGLMSMCVTILLELGWSYVHPQPLPLRVVAPICFIPTLAQSYMLCCAFGVITTPVFTHRLSMALQLVVGLSQITTSQVCTAYVVESGKSPVRYYMLGWITVLTLAAVVTSFPLLARMPWLIISVPVLARTMFQMGIVAGAFVKQGNGGGERHHVRPAAVAEHPPVAAARAARCALLACNGSLGEALNDMATDLKVRAALSAGNTNLSLSYNVAVVLSMCGSYMSETLISGVSARRAFILAWGGCQVVRALGMSYLAPDRLWLMFFFVFLDKLTGLLGESALDTAHLALMGRDGGGQGKLHIHANAIWTFKTMAQRLQRPICQLLLLSTGTDGAHAPAWIPIASTVVSVSFVLHELAPASIRSKRE